MSHGGLRNVLYPSPGYSCCILHRVSLPLEGGWLYRPAIPQHLRFLRYLGIGRSKPICFWLPPVCQDLPPGLAMIADMQQIHIPSDESLEQGRNRSRELLSHTEQPRQSLVGLVGGTMPAALLLLHCAKVQTKACSALCGARTGRLSALAEQQPEGGKAADHGLVSGPHKPSHDT